MSFLGAPSFLHSESIARSTARIEKTMFLRQNCWSKQMTSNRGVGNRDIYRKRTKKRQGGDVITKRYQFATLHVRGKWESQRIQH